MDCACSTCIAACKQLPGWFSPDDAMNAVEAGYASRMTCGITHGEVALLYPSARRDPAHPMAGMPNYRGRCTFLNAEDRCELHATAFKPYECRNTLPCKQEGGLRPELERQWDTRLGALAIKKWQEARV